MADNPLLKDLVDEESVRGIAASLGRVVASFDEEVFVADVFDDEWEERALKQRLRHIAVTMRAHVPGDYRKALGIVRKAAGGIDITGIAAWSFNDFVEEYGVDDPDASLPALEQFTKPAS